MTGVLLSIKPEYVSAILAGRKRFEFRKSRPRRMDGRAYIYATSPVKRIVASFQVEDVVSDRPTELWKVTKHVAGLNASRFFEYFRGEKTGYAWQIGALAVFNPPVDPVDLDDHFTPPQSFCYLNGAREERLKALVEMS